MRERATSFRTLVKEQPFKNPNAWPEEVQTIGIITLTNVLRGIKQDCAAICTALKSSWSNRQIEA